MQSKATTVAAYLKELPAERRGLIEAVRKVMLANVDRGIEEVMNYGMIGYVIPHSIYPSGYHCDPSKPFPYAGLASQKNYCSLYLMPVYNEAEDWFRKEWKRGGKKLNMGKCCIRFSRLDDLDLDVIAKALRRFTIAESLRGYAQALEARTSGKSKPKSASRTAAKQSTQSLGKKRSVKSPAASPVSGKPLKSSVKPRTSGPNAKPQPSTKRTAVRKTKRG